MPRKHSHYYKGVEHLSSVDVYRVLRLFNVTDPAIGHAIKKLLLPGARGAKGLRVDVKEAIDSLQRFIEMEVEDDALEHLLGPTVTIKSSVEPFDFEAAKTGKFERAITDFRATLNYGQSPEAATLTESQVETLLHTTGHCSSQEVCGKAGVAKCENPNECDGKTK